MPERKKRLGDLLVETSIITEEQLQSALAEQKSSKSKLGDVLIRRGYITESQLIQVLEFQLGIPHITLSKYRIDPKLVQVIPEAMARRFQVIPIKKDGKKLTVAMVDPMDYFAIEDLRMSTGFAIEPAIISKDELQRGIARYYGLQDSMDAMARDIRGQEEEIRESEITDEDSPVVRLVNQMVRQAVQLRASDIHVDPAEDGLNIRYRIDGYLRNVKHLPKNMQGIITARLKIMANLNIAERRLPQDGRIKMPIDFKQVDIRVSTLPTASGEKIVLRLLDLSASLKDVEGIGFSPVSRELFLKMIGKPYGIVLITGPTGSGKTTTLYSALQHLNQEQVNIITIEDPVEYRLEGINQVQVNPVTGLTFAAGLRSILRQDPNIIMVGEIRDAETAEIAVRASLTGHRVFSTLHTNDSVGTIVRLRDMGIEPYLISSSLIGVVSQRLVRRICPDCKQAHPVSPQEEIFLDARGVRTQVLYKGNGCGLCGGTGYRGRIAIHELLLMDDDLRRLVTQGASVGELRRQAFNTGMKRLMDDGIAKVLEGHTTLQEIIREAADEWKEHDVHDGYNGARMDAARV